MGDRNANKGRKLVTVSSLTFCDSLKSLLEANLSSYKRALNNFLSGDPYLRIINTVPILLRLKRRHLLFGNLIKMLCPISHYLSILHELDSLPSRSPAAVPNTIQIVN